MSSWMVSGTSPLLYANEELHSQQYLTPQLNKLTRALTRALACFVLGCVPHADVRKLVGPSVLTSEKELALLARVNKEKFAAVSVDGGKSVLITPHGELPDGLYLDPSGPCALEVDHKALTATKSATPLSGAQLGALQGGAAIREAVDREMQAYCKVHVPGSTCTTYGTSGAGIKVVCCTSTRAAELSNYWAGLWMSEWTLEVPMGGSIGTLTGKVQVHVHYFEDGNVQLDDKVVFQSELPASAEEVGGAFAKKVKECEQGLLAKLEETYTSMSDNVLQGLRRRLPITKTKFDWDKVAISKLAADLQSAAGMNIS